MPAKAPEPPDKGEPAMSTDRRNAMMTLAAAGLSASAASFAKSPKPKGFFARTGHAIGLQIYTLGDDAGRDIDATFAQVAAIGYREIELPNLLGKQPQQLAEAAAKAGLKIVSVHMPLLRNGGAMGFSLATDPNKVADMLGTMGAKWAVAPLLLLPEGFRPLPGETFPVTISRSVAGAGEAIWKETASQLNRRAEALKPLGIQVAYHNHNLEFAQIGKTSGWGILLKETNPGLVSFEVDLGWVAAGGHDPVTFLKQVKNRVRLLHVKDVASGTETNYRFGMNPNEVGSGKLGWRKILPVAHQMGVQHFLVEQEPPFAIPRIDAARKSFEFLSRLET